MRRYADKARRKFRHLVKPHIQSVRIFLADLKDTDSRFAKRVKRQIGQTICPNVRATVTTARGIEGLPQGITLDL